MPVNLWSQNTPQNFWQCDPPISSETWEQAVQCAMPTLGLPNQPSDMNDLLKLTLGEGQFGAHHWDLSSTRRLYYALKPFIPRIITRALRQVLRTRHSRDFELGWPIEARYPRFQFEVLRCLLELSGQASIQFRSLWPDGKRFALVLTHDIETDKGQQFVRQVADLEESIGFHSSFNFVPEGYRVDMGLVNELRQRGFEIGIHGLKHDGRLFSSHKEFERRVEKINRYLKDFGATGFRAPLTHRHPEWMQSLDIEYDLSFFDTDPFEPIPGGTMSIWPFFLGHFLELPYTLVQDYTLTSVLGESTPRLWMKKVDFIEEYHGMALLNSHPDYLINQTSWDVYRQFLVLMKENGNYWQALPHEVSDWWNTRASRGSKPAISGKNYATVILKRDHLELIAST
ncbi:MAG: hypothetical protein HZB50_02335 [Chloroflexi bacterium]|nr:hypothetical protein [Chloroflexota bacterium]